MPAPLDRLPWDDAQDLFGTQGADFMKEFGRVLLRADPTQKDQLPVQVLNSS